MQIEIVQAFDGRSVRFRAAGAEIVGVWKGSVPPRVGPALAELGLAPVTWDSVVEVASEEMLAEGVLRCELLDLGADGVGTIRFGDGVTLVEFVGVAPPGVVGSTIEFRPLAVEVFPYDL